MNDFQVLSTTAYRALLAKVAAFRVENENLKALNDELYDELDDAYNTIALYEEEDDLELDALLDQALNELFPEELHDRA